MALTVASINGDGLDADVWGRSRVRVVDVTFDSSYDTGGESFTPSNVGLHEIDAVIVTGDTGGYVIEYDRANQKLVAYQQTDPAAIGGADIPLTEVAAATDLSAVTVTAIAIGR